MIGVAEALAIVDREAQPLGPERVPLDQAALRVLAETVASDVDWPPFDTSAMDGYAVLLRDAAAPGASARERPGVMAAGNAPPAPLTPGETVRIMTGAPIPDGTEAIVPVEQAEQQGGRVVFSAVPAAGAHLRRRGESIAAGAPLLTPGLRADARPGGARGPGRRGPDLGLPEAARRNRGDGQRARGRIG